MTLPHQAAPAECHPAVTDPHTTNSHTVGPHSFPPPSRNRWSKRRTTKDFTTIGSKSFHRLIYGQGQRAALTFWTQIRMDILSRPCVWQQASALAPYRRYRGPLGKSPLHVSSSLQLALHRTETLRLWERSAELGTHTGHRMVMLWPFRGRGFIAKTLCAPTQAPPPTINRTRARLMGCAYIQLRGGRRWGRLLCMLWFKIFSAWIRKYSLKSTFSE